MPVLPKVTGPRLCRAHADVEAEPEARVDSTEHPGSSQVNSLGVSSNRGGEARRCHRWECASPPWSAQARTAQIFLKVT